MGLTGRLKAAVCAVPFLMGATSAHAQEKTGTIVGIVVEAASARSISDATIEIQSLGRTVRSNGRGIFSFGQLPLGEYTVTARAIGFAMFRTTVRVSDQLQTEVPIELPRNPALDTMNVISAVAKEPVSFLEARALGLGSFVSYDLLSKSGDRRLGDVLTTVRSVGVIQGRGGTAYVLSRRRGPSLRPASIPTATGASRNRPGDVVYYPEKEDEGKGIVPACYARVYLDRQLLNPSTPAEPVNINDYNPRDILAIEFYAGPGSLPPHLSNVNATCGVMVIHTPRGRQIP